MLGILHTNTGLQALLWREIKTGEGKRDLQPPAAVNPADQHVVFTERSFFLFKRFISLKRETAGDLKKLNAH